MAKNAKFKKEQNNINTIARESKKKYAPQDLLLPTKQLAKHNFQALRFLVYQHEGSI